jgi:DNA-directed RNA polymerase
LDRDDENLALRLLIAGISVCDSNTLGTDKYGEKTFRDIALWIGRNLSCQGELALRVGGWGVEMLRTLPIFVLEAGDVLAPSALAVEFVSAFLARHIRNNPWLSPFATPPEPWTGIRKGLLPPDHWACVPFIRQHHPSIEVAARKAIGTGQMQKVLDAVNALQAVAYTINKPVLDFMPRLAARGPESTSASERDQDNAAAKLRAWQMDMVIAEAMADYERFYVPLNIDFRGRVFGVPHFNLTREDHVRGLLLFADGKLLWIGQDFGCCTSG